MKMTALMNCLNQLKTDLQKIADASMTQCYEGLDVPLLEDSDSQRAQVFSESFSGNSFNNPYSKKALQAVWNLVDILSIALTYTPCEWSLGILRGFMAKGSSNKTNLSLLIESINYIDSISMMPTPFVVDDVTYMINLELIKFITEVRKTKNGRSLFDTLNQLCRTMLFQTISIDEEIINTATKRINTYIDHQEKRSSALEQSASFIFSPDRDISKLTDPTVTSTCDGSSVTTSETMSDAEQSDGDLIFYDAQESPEFDFDSEPLEFYDAMQDPVKKNNILEKVKEKIILLTIEFSANVLVSLKVKRDFLHETSKSKKKYNDIINLIEEMNIFILNPENNLGSVRVYLGNINKLDSALKDLPFDFGDITDAFEYFKKNVNFWLEKIGLPHLFAEKNRSTVALLNTYKKNLLDLINQQDKTLDSDSIALAHEPKNPD